jgi:hypothetical protein
LLDECIAISYPSHLRLCPRTLSTNDAITVFFSGTKQEYVVARGALRIQREAERQFPVRVRIAVPPGGFGRQLELMHAWLDEVCGPTGWISAPAGFAGVINDAVAFYFDDAAFAHAFVNRFCCGYRPVEINRAVEGAFSLRTETPPRRVALTHKTP